ncbi:MAG: carboxylesterase/lipase family protein [Acidimicrobiales bacterium]
MGLSAEQGHQAPGAAHPWAMAGRPPPGHPDGPAQVWRGIPYSTPPVGERRFGLPSAPPSWEEAGGLSQFAEPCIQLAPRGISLPESTPGGSEDCLYLNVWSPSGPDARLPVLVWFHGGQFLFGSGNNFSGAALAARIDVVVVTVNYRLGPWGFSPPYLPSARGSIYPNLGLLDQVAALRWVQANVSQLGGDPGRVTIAGQGSGATSVLSLLAMPIAQRLFDQAALLSPQMVSSSQKLEASAPSFADALGVDIRRVSSALRSFPNTSITQAASALISAPPSRPGWRPEIFAPWVDGKVLAFDPMASITEGNAAGVPLLVATCAREASLQAAVDPSSAEACEAGLRRNIGDVAWHALSGVYRKAAEDGNWRISILTDGLYRLPAIRIAERQAAAGGAAWLLTFDHHTRVPPLDRIGACHGSELPFLWSDPTRRDASYFPGLDSPHDVWVATTLQSVLAGFAHTGRPGSALNVPWNPYTVEDRSVLRLGPGAELEHDPAPERRQSWNGLRFP